MISYDKPSQVFAACLSALAGFVDATGFLHLGGYFASFMSGNSTRLAVGLAGGTPGVLTAAWLIGTFVLGVMLGALASHVGHRHRRPAVLSLVSLLLLAAALLANRDHDSTAVFAMVLAMGAENAVFQRNGDVTIGLTYMTGALVKFGLRLMAALLGGDRYGWLPYLMLWLGLVFGAVLGALVFRHLGLQGLWIAAALAVLLTGFSFATRAVD